MDVQTYCQIPNPALHWDFNSSLSSRLTSAARYGDIPKRVWRAFSTYVDAALFYQVSVEVGRDTGWRAYVSDK